MVIGRRGGPHKHRQGCKEIHPTWEGPKRPHGMWQVCWIFKRGQAN